MASRPREDSLEEEPRRHRRPSSGLSCALESTDDRGLEWDMTTDGRSVPAPTIRGSPRCRRAELTFGQASIFFGLDSLPVIIA